MAFAALLTDERPLVSIISAPLFCTIAIKSLSSHSRSSLRISLNGSPLTRVWKVFGYWVEEWLPQIARFVICPISILYPFYFSFWQIYQVALFWSNLVRAEKFSLGIEGAAFWHKRALVLHGFPTIITLTFFLATSFIILPWDTKMLAFSSKRSDLSMPFRRGLEPTKIAKSASLNAAT